MAAHSAKKSQPATLGAGVEDVVTLTQMWDEIEVFNQHATDAITFTTNNTAAVIGADDVSIVGPGSGLKVRPDAYVGRSVIVRLISASACPYLVSGVR